jgi:hypothetical protein
MRVEAAKMIVRNAIYLCTIVPMNLGAGLSFFVLVLLWSMYRNARDGSGL